MNMKKIWLVLPFLFIVPVLTHAQLDSLGIAASTGDTNDLRILIAAGTDVNATDSDRTTLLMYAAIAGHTEVVQILIAAGANVNATEGEDGMTVIGFAALGGLSSEVVQTLIAAGADVNAKANDGRTALSLAEGGGHSDISRMLVVAGAEDAELDRLMRAAFNGYTDDLRILIAAGADVNARNDNDSSALFFAAVGGHTEAVQTLIAAGGADVNETDGVGWTALMLAASDGHTETAETLIVAGADVNAAEINGVTALMVAADEGHTETVQTLIAAGADVNLKDSNGRTALNIAEIGGHSDVSRMLVVAGAEETVLPEGSQPLYHEAENQAPVAITEVRQTRQYTEVNITVVGSTGNVCWAHSGPNSPYLLSGGRRYPFVGGDAIVDCPTRMTYTVGDVMTLRFQPLGLDAEEFSLVEGEAGENQLLDPASDSRRYWNFFRVRLD